ncbi:hypothetical protein F5Y10DRAFT_102481 [Nemania abortiva]|nr:hypothetical protein F5Y10DRAFT_102481 [Nemania abortiva]
MIQNSCSHRLQGGLPKGFDLFEFDSNGSRHYSISAATCDLCNNRRDIPTSVFQVFVSHDTLSINFFSNDLRRDLTSVFGIKITGSRGYCNGRELLKHYPALRAHLNGLRGSEHTPKMTRAPVEEWALLVEGFLENHAVLRYFDFEELYNDEPLGAQLRAAFMQQELERDINRLEKLMLHGRSTLGTLGSGVSYAADQIDYQADYFDCRLFEGLEEFHEEERLKKLREEEGWPGHIMRKVYEERRLRELREEERLWKLRLNFNKQYELLRQVAQTESLDLNPHSPRLKYTESAWAAGINTMRRLSRLQPYLDLTDVLCFLCISRAVAETGENDGATCVSEFPRYLNEWREIFPEIGKISWLMWEIDLNHVPGLSVPEDAFQAYSRIWQLRLSVCELITEANKLFSLEHPNLYNKTYEIERRGELWPANIEQALRATKPPDPPATATAREKEPPDRRVYSDTIAHEEETPPLRISDTVILVTSVIFALVFRFIMGFVCIPLTTVLGFPNPSQPPMPQADTSSQIIPPETFTNPMLSPPLPTKVSVTNNDKPSSFMKSNPPSPDLNSVNPQWLDNRHFGLLT